MKDWVGNKKSVFITLGASNHTTEERQSEDLWMVCVGKRIFRKHGCEVD